MSHRRFNFAQRFVVVVGVGIALSFVGRWVMSLGSHLTNTGWTGYAPLSTSSPSSFVGGLHPWVRLVLWLVLVVVWTAVSLVVLRSPRDRVDGA